MRLYCLPHAGGSANVFLGWREFLDESIELVPVELSGRGRRIASPLHGSFGDVLADIAREMGRQPIPADYALLGHSFGGLLAFELAHELASRGHGPPSHLFVSASGAPQRAQEMSASLAEGVPLSGDNRDLLGSLAHLGGTPLEILADDEAVDLFAPVLRADLYALLSYRYVSRGKLSCDISILLGSRDSVANRTDAALWAALASGNAWTQVIDGGHFAAFERPGDVASHVNATLAAPAIRRHARSDVP